MRIAEVKRTSALFCAVFFILTAALLASGCAGTAVTETEKSEALVAEEKAQKSEDSGYKDTDTILKFKGETLNYADIKDIWTCATGKKNPEEFESLTGHEKNLFIKQLSVNMLAAKKAREKNLLSDNYYRAREYELITRYMPTVYAEKVTAVEVNPTDAELLMAAPPALPEVVVRVFVSKTMEDAKSAYDRIKSGEDMGALVKAESKGLSASDGGMTKWMTIQNSDKFPVPVVQKFLDADVGTVFEPFFQDVGFLVVRVEGKHSPEEVQKIWLEQNRDEEVFKLRKARFQERTAELMEKGDKVKFDPAMWEDIRARKITKEQTIVTVRDIELSLESIIPDLMKMSSGHGDDQVLGRVAKFIERAVITEDSYARGLELSPDMKRAVEFQAMGYLSTVLKRKVADEAMEGEITEEHIRKYYDDNPLEFTQPTQYCVSLMEFPDFGKAADVCEKTKAGEDFAELAKLYSVNESGKYGGAIGCYEEKEIPKEIAETIKGMEAGKCSEAPLKIALKDGGSAWLLLKLDSVQNPAVVSFDRVKRPIVENRIKTQRRTEALGSLLNSLVKEYGYENCFIPKIGKEKVSQ